MKTALIYANMDCKELRPITYELPPSLLPIQGKALIEHIVEELKNIGINKLYIFTNYLNEHIITFFKYRPLDMKIDFLVERNPKDTGGALLMIHPTQKQNDFNEDFLIIYGNYLSEIDWKNFKEYHHKNNSILTFASSDINNNSIIKDIEEFKNNKGIYLCSPNIFELLPSKNCFSLEEEVFPSLIKHKKLFCFRNNSVEYTINNPKSWEDAILNWKKEKKEKIS
jgi:NDP-mannose synthase